MPDPDHAAIRREAHKLTVISLGAGVQSTTMALMAAHGEITPMPDCAIFADTGDESRATYEHLAWLASGNVLPFPVEIVSAGRKLSDDLRDMADPNGTKRFAAVPFFVRWVEKVRAAAGTIIGEQIVRGKGRRQCTREFKVDPIAKHIRARVGAKPGQRLPRDCVTVMIGIPMTSASGSRKAATAGRRTSIPSSISGCGGSIASVGSWHTTIRSRPRALASSARSSATPSGVGCAIKNRRNGSGQWRLTS